MIVEIVPRFRLPVAFRRQQKLVLSYEGFRACIEVIEQRSNATTSQRAVDIEGRAKSKPTESIMARCSPARAQLRSGDPSCAYAEDDKDCQRPECLPDWPARIRLPGQPHEQHELRVRRCSDRIYVAEDLENVKFLPFHSNAVHSMNVQESPA